MRQSVWKKTAMIAMKQQGFQKNIINHKFYCEWPHCLALAVFEDDEQGMKVRLDIYKYNPNEIMDLQRHPDEVGYLMDEDKVLFSLDVSKEEVYDQIINAMKQTIPELIGNLK